MSDWRDKFHDPISTLRTENARLREALKTVGRVLDDAPDNVVAELWVSDTKTLGLYVDMALADIAAAEAGVTAIRDALEGGE